MFFIDKYAPTSIKNAYFHKDLLKMLQVMSKDESIPHIIFYGPEGSGKKTIIKLLLEILYDKDVNKTNDAIYKVVGSGSTSVDVPVKQSNYHIVIEPNNTNFDRYLIQDVVKEYAKRVPLDIFTTKKIFKTVLINSVDRLSYYAQTSLRRTMEKNSNRCRFIMWCKSLSKVIEPLRSRCLCIRVSSPSYSDLFARIYEISVMENIKLDLTEYTTLINNANGNIKKALWLLELAGQNKQNTHTTYDETIVSIIKLIKTGDMHVISKIREFLYNIMITNIDGTRIIKDIVIRLCNDKIPNICVYNIIESAGKFEHNLIRGRREIIHLESFINSVMKILHDYNKITN